MALRHDSIADQPDTVSVGSPGEERRITNVANGIADTDAANMGQLRDTRDDLRNGIAAAVSIVTLTPSGPGKTVINVGWGYSKKENAIGATINHRLRIWEDKKVLEGTVMMLNAGVGFGFNGDPAIRAGGSFEFWPRRERKRGPGPRSLRLVRRRCSASGMPLSYSRHMKLIVAT